MSNTGSTGNAVSQLTTRAEHHAESDKQKVRRAKDQIAWILERRDCREYAISSKGLARATGWKPDEPHDGIKPTTVRDSIKEICRDRPLPIVSYNKGYYLISTTVEMRKYHEKKQAEIETHEETLQEKVAAFNAMRYERGES